MYTLNDEYARYITERVRMLLEAGADVNVRVRFREYDSVLDREGVSVLERTRRLMCQYSSSECSLMELYRYFISRFTEHIETSFLTYICLYTISLRVYSI